MKDPVVLITGALTGIGRATALAFVNEGGRIVASGRRDAEGHELVAELRKLGAEAEFLRSDVRHEDDVRSLVDKTVARFGRLDVAVMSPYHFARRFQHSTGLPPHRFVVQQRIARARAFLATQEQSVAQISRLVGFRTPSHFTTVFRRVTGLTPGAYRTAALRADRPGREGG